MSIFSSFVILFFLANFSVSDILCVDILSVRHFVLSTFCLSTFCLFDILSVDIMSVDILSVDILSAHPYFHAVNGSTQFSRKKCCSKNDPFKLVIEILAKLHISTRYFHNENEENLTKYLWKCVSLLGIEWIVKKISFLGRYFYQQNFAKYLKKFQLANICSKESRAGKTS